MTARAEDEKTWFIEWPDVLNVKFRRYSETVDKLREDFRIAFERDIVLSGGRRSVLHDMLLFGPGGETLVSRHRLHKSLIFRDDYAVSEEPL